MAARVAEMFNRQYDSLPTIMMTSSLLLEESGNPIWDYIAPHAGQPEDNAWQAEAGYVLRKAHSSMEWYNIN
jgi:hypothetical protein